MSKLRPCAGAQRLPGAVLPLLRVDDGTEAGRPVVRGGPPAQGGRSHAICTPPPHHPPSFRGQPLSGCLFPVLVITAAPHAGQPATAGVPAGDISRSPGRMQKGPGQVGAEGSHGEASTSGLEDTSKDFREGGR